ncbi:hypothetical protein AOUC001_20155 [Proteus mirabilis]|nr:hypothetical protein AOUC001_20155 [Proteus mirabilis]
MVPGGDCYPAGGPRRAAHGMARVAGVPAPAANGRWGARSGWRGPAHSPRLPTSHGRVGWQQHNRAAAPCPSSGSATGCRSSREVAIEALDLAFGLARYGRHSRIRNPRSSAS